MEIEQFAAVMAVTASVTAVLAAVVGAVTHYTSTLDRRSFRGPISRLYSHRNDTWATVQADPGSIVRGVVLIESTMFKGHR